LRAVETTDGCRDSVTRTVIIRPKPTAAFNVNAQNCLGDLVQFNNASSSNTTFEWNFGDNSPVNTQENPSHLYTTSGLYNVTLVATNNFGCRDTIVRPVAATQPAAVPFTATINPNSPWEVQFNANNTGLASYRWNFGDSRTGNGSSITHTYTRAGTFDVELTVSDANNCTNTTTQSVTIERGVGLGDVLAAKYAFNMSPNPFTDVAKVRFSLDQAAEVKIEVYDMMGRKLKSYDMQQLAQGDHLVDINANDFKAKAAAYLIKVSINDESFTRTLIHNK
jgi:PKD repeat protein